MPAIVLQNLDQSNLGHSDLLGWLCAPQIRVPETASANILHATVVDDRGAEASHLEFVGIKHHRRVTNSAVRRRFFSIRTPKIVSPVIGQALSKAQNVGSLLSTQLFHGISHTKTP